MWLKKLHSQILFATISASILVTAVAESQTISDANSVFSVEGAFFHPRRGDFRDIYGQGFPALSARVDVPFKNTTWVCLKGRFVKMSEFDDLDYLNASLGVLLKKDIEQESNLNFYAAIGPQLDYRRISYLVQSGGASYNDSTLSQTEWSPSIAAEAGLDLWINSGFKISPHVDFTYFPFGDPTTGDFGDTGGFYFVLGMGFRL